MTKRCADQGLRKMAERKAFRLSVSSPGVPHLPQLTAQAVQVGIDDRLGDARISKVLFYLGNRTAGYLD